MVPHSIVQFCWHAQAYSAPINCAEPSHGWPKFPCKRSLHDEHVGIPLELELLEPESHNPPQSFVHDLHVQS